MGLVVGRDCHCVVSQIPSMGNKGDQLGIVSVLEEAWFGVVENGETPRGMPRISKPNLIRSFQAAWLVVGRLQISGVWGFFQRSFEINGGRRGDRLLLFDGASSKMTNVDGNQSSGHSRFLCS